MFEYIRLFDAGKLDRAYPTVLARHGILRYRHGRRFSGRPSAKDVMSVRARRLHGFGLERLNSYDHERGQFREAIVEDSRTPILDQVAFRMDFPRWFRTHSKRHQQMAQALAVGHTPSEIGWMFKMSAGRISQLRRKWKESWERFQGEGTMDGGGPLPAAGVA
jgi:hypothetical protein